MNTGTITAVDSEELADSQAVFDHVVHLKPLDPEVYRRVHERAAVVTERLRQEHGTMEVAVDLIRQVRAEE